MLLYLAKFIDEGKQTNTEELKQTLMRSVKSGSRYQPPSSLEIDVSGGKFEIILTCEFENN